MCREGFAEEVTFKLSPNRVRIYQQEKEPSQELETCLCPAGMKQGVGEGMGREEAAVIYGALTTCQSWLYEV